MSYRLAKSLLPGFLLVTTAFAATPKVEPEAFLAVSGKEIQIPASRAKATVLVFVSSTCPIANGNAPEVNRLVAEFGNQGVEFRLVHTETRLTQTEAEEHLKKFSYECPIVFDPKRKLVKQTGATITPEVAVLTPGGVVVYRGRIDDRFPEIGVHREKPTKTELRDALVAVIAGKPVPVATTKAIGCLIA